jgi:hypothetical protein
VLLPGELFAAPRRLADACDVEANHANVFAEAAIAQQVKLFVAVESLGGHDPL